jgi:hypothetical protein
MLLVYPYHRSGVRPPQPVLAVKHEYNDREHRYGPSWRPDRASGDRGDWRLRTEPPSSPNAAGRAPVVAYSQPLLDTAYNPGRLVTQ